jgi:hypothetical protein
MAYRQHRRLQPGARRQAGDGARPRWILSTRLTRDESNNSASVSVGIGLPDLTASIEYSTRSVCVLRLPNGVCFRTATVLDRAVTVRNDGVADASPAVVHITISWLSYGSNSPWISAPAGWYCTERADEAYSHRWRCSSPAMAAGSTAKIVALHFYPPTSGLVTEVQLDPQVSVLESNEGNNFVSNESPRNHRRHPEGDSRGLQPARPRWHSRRLRRGVRVLARERLLRNVWG